MELTSASVEYRRSPRPSGRPTCPPLKERPMTTLPIALPRPPDPRSRRPAGRGRAGLPKPCGPSGPSSSPCGRPAGHCSSPSAGTLLVTFLARTAPAPRPAAGTRGSTPPTRPWPGSPSDHCVWACSASWPSAESTARERSAPRSPPCHGAASARRQGGGRRACDTGHRRGLELPLLLRGSGRALEAAAPTAPLGQPGVLRALVLSGAFLALFALSGWVSAPSSATPPEPSPPSPADPPGAHPVAFRLARHRPLPPEHLCQLDRGGRQQRTRCRAQSGLCSWSPTAPLRSGRARSCSTGGTHDARFDARTRRPGADPWAAKCRWP